MISDTKFKPKTIDNFLVIDTYIIIDWRTITRKGEPEGNMPFYLCRLDASIFGSVSIIIYF